MRRCQVLTFVAGSLLCQIVQGMPALTLPATITVNTQGGAATSPNLDAISTSIGSAAQQLLGGELSSQTSQLNGGNVGGSLNVEGLQGLSGLASGLTSNGVGLTSGGLRSFSVTSSNGAGATLSTSASNGGNLDASLSPSSTSSSSSSDAENMSQGTAIRSGIQQFSPMGKWVARAQSQNDGTSFGQRELSFGSRPDGVSSATSNVVPQGSWVIDVSSFGDTTSAPNNFPRFSDQSTPTATFVQSSQSPIAATWSAHQQAEIRPPINSNYVQEYVMQPSTSPTVYYTVAEAQNPSVASARSLGYSIGNSDGLHMLSPVAYARNGGGVNGGPVSGQAYFASGQVLPTQQFQLAF